MADKVKSPEDLKRIKEKARRDYLGGQGTGTKIIVGMGTCGIINGARETLKAILDELAANNIEATISSVGCIGMCAEEPLVDIVQGSIRVSYRKVTADKVSRIIHEHLLNGKVVEEWVVGKLDDVQS
jgi:NADP-reducing hydrogenase subunit HndB